MPQDPSYNLDDFLRRGPFSSTTRTTSAPIATTRSVLNSRGGIAPNIFPEEDTEDMASAFTNSAANVAPPEQGECYRVAITASSVVRNLPSTWNNKYISVMAVGQDCQIQFGRTGDTLSLTLNQASSGTPPAMTASNATGITLKDGVEVSYAIWGHTQFAIVGASATGYVEIWLSENSNT